MISTATDMLQMGIHFGTNLGSRSALVWSLCTEDFASTHRRRELSSRLRTQYSAIEFPEAFHKFSTDNQDIFLCGLEIGLRQKLLDEGNLRLNPRRYSHCIYCAHAIAVATMENYGFNLSGEQEHVSVLKFTPGGEQPDNWHLPVFRRALAKALSRSGHTPYFQAGFELQLRSEGGPAEHQCLLHRSSGGDEAFPPYMPPPQM